MPHLRELSEPLAINMWDFTWLQRHHPTGEFWDLDRALDGLVERGYNAVRIDVFPHMIADGPEGERVETFTCCPRSLGYAVWGNRWTVAINPREMVPRFLEKCRERGVYVGLSTWFVEDAGGRHARIQGKEAFVRVWDETLRYLAERDCLSNVIYVDLLNEYPYWHGFSWLPTMLSTMSEPRPAHGDHNAAQRDYYSRFLYDCLDELKARWPALDFLSSQTHDWDEFSAMDYRHFDLLDIHVWFVHASLGQESGYNAEIHPMRTDAQWPATFAHLTRLWAERRAEYIAWMDAKMGQYAAAAARYGIPLGNTEGWGAILWNDHPALTWDFIKEAGEICAHLGVKHGYRFNCTSNFNHPYFGLWDDIAWHQRVTSIIRSAPAGQRAE